MKSLDTVYVTKLCLWRGSEQKQVQISRLDNTWQEYKIWQGMSKIHNQLQNHNIACCQNKFSMATLTALQGCYRTPRTSADHQEHGADLCIESDLGFSWRIQSASKCIPSERISEPATVKERDFVELAVGSLQRRRKRCSLSGMKHLNIWSWNWLHTSETTYLFAILEHKPRNVHDTRCKFAHQKEATGLGKRRSWW